MGFGSPRKLIYLAVASWALTLAPPAWADDGALPGATVVETTAVEVNVAASTASVTVAASASAEPAPPIDVQVSAAEQAPPAAVRAPVEAAPTVTVTAAATPASVSAGVAAKAAGAAASIQTPAGPPARAAGATEPAAAPRSDDAVSSRTVRREAGARRLSPRKAPSGAEHGRTTSVLLDELDSRLDGPLHRASDPASRAIGAPVADRIADAAAAIRIDPAPPSPSLPQQPGALWSVGTPSGGAGPLVLVGLLLTLVSLAPPGVRGGVVLLGTTLGPRRYGVPLERPG